MGRFRSEGNRLIEAFGKAIGQLGDPKARQVVWQSIGVSIVAFLGLWGGVGFVLANTAVFEMAWLDATIDVLGGLAVLVISWLLFPALVSACIGLFLERIADAVEQRHYPYLPPAREAPMGEVVATTLRFLAIMLVLNLLVLGLLLVPPVFPFVFYGANGYLLGREYFELAALRRMNASEASVLRAAHRGQLFAAGLVIALLLTVPLVNLIAPIIGTAAMVHLVEGWRSNRRG